MCDLGEILLARDNRLITNLISAGQYFDARWNFFFRDWSAAETYGCCKIVSLAYLRRTILMKRKVSALVAYLTELKPPSYAQCGKYGNTV